jgi:hypothetical protein
MLGRAKQWPNRQSISQRQADRARKLKRGPVFPLSSAREHLAPTVPGFPDSPLFDSAM